MLKLNDHRLNKTSQQQLDQQKKSYLSSILQPANIRVKSNSTDQASPNLKLWNAHPGATNKNPPEQESFSTFQTTKPITYNLGQQRLQLEQWNFQNCKRLNKLKTKQREVPYPKTHYPTSRATTLRVNSLNSILLQDNELPTAKNSSMATDEATIECRNN